LKILTFIQKIIECFLGRFLRQNNELFIHIIIEEITEKKQSLGSNNNMIKLSGFQCIPLNAVYYCILEETFHVAIECKTAIYLRRCFIHNIAKRHCYASVCIRAQYSSEINTFKVLFLNLFLINFKFPAWEYFGKFRFVF